MENRRDTFMYQDAAAFCELKCRAELKQSTVKPIRKAAYTVARYFETGEFSWGSVTFTANAPASGAYRELMSGFQQELSKRLSPGTVRPEMIIIRQFLYFLEQAGVEDAHSMVSENVLDFVRQEAPNHKGSMPRLLRTLRNFVQFLRDKGIVDLDADRFLGTAGRCRQKALPCFTDEELQLIFSKIDRSTDKGRRDYAIFLLAVRTGMRASDISGLKLSDICWTEKTIRVVQKKTKVTLLLPLPIDAGNAIADYILHSRPRTDNPYVFVRLFFLVLSVRRFLMLPCVDTSKLQASGVPAGMANLFMHYGGRREQKCFPPGIPYPLLPRSSDTEILSPPNAISHWTAEL